MPVYTYECENCGVRFDRQKKYNERNLTRCPECGKNTLHRVYRPVGVVFKGSGFYVTDNRSSAASRLASPPDNKKDEKASTKEKAEKVEKAKPVDKTKKSTSNADTQSGPAD